MMKLGTRSVEYTMMMPSVLGSRCRRMMRAVPAPIERAASTNSLALSEMIWPRTTRATVSQLTSDSATKRLTMLRPKIAMKMMTSSMYGSPYMTSTNRVMR